MKHPIYLILITMFSCDPIPEESENCHREILIKNVGTEDVFFSFEPIYETLPKKLPCPFGLIEPDSFRVDPSTLTSCWEDIIKNLYEDTLSYYFVLGDDYQMLLPCDSISVNNPLMEERRYTVEDLNALNWIIEYP